MSGYPLCRAFRVASSLREIFLIGSLGFHLLRKSTGNIVGCKAISRRQWIRSRISYALNILLLLALCLVCSRPVFIFGPLGLRQLLLEDIILHKCTDEVEATADLDDHLLRVSHTPSFVDLAPLGFKGLVELLEVKVLYDRFLPHTEAEFGVDTSELLEEYHKLVVLDL